MESPSQSEGMPSRHTIEFFAEFYNWQDLDKILTRRKVTPGERMEVSRLFNEHVENLKKWRALKDEKDQGQPNPEDL